MYYDLTFKNHGNFHQTRRKYQSILLNISSHKSDQIFIGCIIPYVTACVLCVYLFH